MPKRDTLPTRALDIKRQLQATDRELSRIHALQWMYAKRLLKFGIICWVIGLSMFFTAIMIINVNLLPLLPQYYSIWVPLLIIAFAAPVIITAVMLRKFVMKIKYLERLRRTLLTEYEKAILKRVEKIIVGR